MKLRAAEDGHNVYVLYSDLLFNLLILFLIIVLALVLRMNYTMQAVQQAHAGPETQPLADASTQPVDDPEANRRLIASLIRAHLDDADKIAVARADEAAAQRRAVDATEQIQADQRTIRAQQQQVAAANESANDAKRQAARHDTVSPTITQQLAIAAGANRFSGRSGSTSMCVALDLSGDEPKYVLVNASAFSSASATLDGESDARHKVRAAGVLHDAIDGVTRFAPDELRDVFRALDVNLNRGGDGTAEGQLLFNFSGHATMVASGVEDRTGNDNIAIAPPALREMMTDGGFAEYHQNLINDLIRLRDSLHPPRTPQSVPVLHFSAEEDQSVIQIGQRSYPVADFRQIVASFGQGGIILQYDPSHGELCPDWIIRDVLTRTGYTNAVPDPAELKRLREKLQKPGGD